MKTKIIHVQERPYIFALLIVIAVSAFAAYPAFAVPTGPVITYVSNSSLQPTLTNRSQDAKGTITTLLLNSLQQDYKWKAYVGNVTGKLTLDDANSKAIYDWSLSSIAGEVFVTRSSSVTWTGVACANQTVIDKEESAFGTTSSIPDSINSTFNYTTHKSFLVGSINVTANSCRSTATYINGVSQAVTDTSTFQEVLLQDNSTGSLVYTSLINPGQVGYDGASHFDFQMLVAENESASTPSTYYFYVELG